MHNLTWHLMCFTILAERPNFKWKPQSLTPVTSSFCYIGLLCYQEMFVSSQPGDDLSDLTHAETISLIPARCQTRAMIWSLSCWLLENKTLNRCEELKAHQAWWGKPISEYVTQEGSPGLYVPSVRTSTIMEWGIRKCDNWLTVSLHNSKKPVVCYMLQKLKQQV